MITARVQPAFTDVQRRAGLTGRASLPWDEGMAFFMPRTDYHAMTMRNVPIALDMIFVDAAGIVVGVIHDAQPETARLQINRASQIVVEMNAGWARAHHIDVGSRVQIECGRLAKGVFGPEGWCKLTAWT